MNKVFAGKIARLLSEQVQARREGAQPTSGRQENAPALALDALRGTTARSPLNFAASMANPKRKTSKRRSAHRRAANAFQAPQFATDPTDGSLFRPHRVNPKNGMYRGRQVLNVEV